MNDESLPRGTVTFLFSDIEDSTGLLRQAGNDLFARIRADHHRLLREAFAAHDGHEIDTAGDGFFVAFDSARSAVTAAIDGQLALSGFAWPDGAEVRVRMGLHTAEPLLGEDGYVGVGIHRASRICDAARGGQILVSNATAGIVEDAELPGTDLVDLGEHTLKGLERGQRLFQLTAAGLTSEFGPPRTSEPEPRPGAGTFLAVDLSGWRHVIRALGDEASAELTAEWHAVVTSTVGAHGGVVLEQAADFALAVFGVASDALRAARALRDGLEDFTWPPECDVAFTAAVHTGRWSGDARRPQAGTAISRVNEILRVVGRGQVLVSQTTASLVEGDREAPALRSLGERSLPRSDDAVHVHELLASS